MNYSDNTTARFDSSNMIHAGSYPGFDYYVPAQRMRGSEDPNIQESISEGPPSEGFHRDFYWNIMVGELPSARGEGYPEPEPVFIEANLSVDDLGQFSMGPLFINLPPEGPNGGSPGQSDSDFGYLPPGFYSAYLSYDNIDFKKQYNKAFMEFTLNAGSGKIVPTDNEDPPCDCDPCDCDCECSDNDEDSGNRTAPGGSSSDPSRRGRNQSLISPRVSSSGGRLVTATSNKNNMLWQANFGTFRGLAGVPGGMLEISVRNFSVQAWSITSLNYNHPMASKLEKPAGAVVIGQPNTVFKAVSGARYDNYLVAGDGKSMSGAGVSTKTTNALRFVSADTARSEGVKSESNSLLEIRKTDKSSMVYATHSGLPESYNTWSGRRISAQDFSRYLDVVRAEDGSIRQVWNLWDGLTNIENISSEGYTIALYLASQVGEKESDTGLYPVTGEAFKTFHVGTNEARNRLVVTETAAGREPYVSSWWQTSGTWSMSRGTGEDEIVTLREKTLISFGQYKITTTIQRGMNGEAVSRTEELFTTTDEGTLKNAKIAYSSGGGTGGASIRTDYSYDAAGRKQETSPQYSVAVKGASLKSGYDTHSRPNVTYEPWAGGSSKATYTYYKDGDFYDSDIDYQRIVLIKDGNATAYQRIEYSYASVNHVRRVEKRTTGLGSDKTQLEVTETWLGTSPNPHAQGRVKMTQGIDGVQLHYSYDEDASHGALYRQTAETRVNGAAISGQSIRKVNYVSADGNDLRKEEYALLSNNTWELLDAADYEYDEENRWIKRTRSNGRVMERAMMCCGPLWEKDEDGVLTTYGYNTARQLVEVIRAATETTPETITSYTRDAMDRILEKRVDVGSMTFIERSVYDLQGRITSFTDDLGRETNYAYSEDVLTITETTPTGATLITRIHPDGTILEQSGTGQRHLIHTVEAATEGIRTTIATPNPSGEARNLVLSRTIVDGFGQTVKEEVPNKDGELMVTSHVYNEKGQEVRRTKATLAPLLFEYDAMGKLSGQTVKLADTPTPLNSRITEWLSEFVKKDDGIYRQENRTNYTPDGSPIRQNRRKLISFLHSVLADKIVMTDARGNETCEWTEYAAPTKRLRKLRVPTSATIAENTVIDGFTVQEKDEAGVIVTYARAIKESGATITRTDARGNASIIEQDIAGRIIKETDASGNVSTIAYDVATLHPSLLTNALGQTTCYVYDTRGRKTAEHGTGIQPALYAYDEADNLISLTTFRAVEETITSDPSGHTDGDTTTWEYDPASRLLLKKTYADGKTEIYDYDELNRLEISMNGRATMSTRTYAPLTGELLSLTCKDGATTKTPVITCAYNHLGMLTSVTDGAGTHSFGYNDYNELLSESTQGVISSELEYSYDTLGRSSGYTLNCGGAEVQNIAYTYDAKGRPGGVSMNGIAEPFTYGYNAENGLPETLSYPNTIIRRHTYENKRDLAIKADYLRPGSTNSPAKVEYTYDALARPVTKKDTFNTVTPDLTHTYEYNGRSELVSDAMSRGGSFNYDYDNIGNRKTSQEGSQAPSVLYIANPLNQYANIVQGMETAFQPSYDPDGNQTKVKTASGEWEIIYNALNQAIRFTQGTKRIECLYDYMGRRVEKNVYEGESLQTKKRFLYKGYLQIAELDATNETETAPPILRNLYLWDPAEPAASRVLAMRHFDETRSNPEDMYFTHDNLKNTIALFGIQAGRRALYEYGPFGAVIKSDGDMAMENSFRFSSEYHDDETGLIYYNYRYLNTMDGRWISRDSIGELNDNNLYTFSFNSFVIDILGLEAQDTQKSPCQQALDHLRKAIQKEIAKECAEQGIPAAASAQIGKEAEAVGEKIMKKYLPCLEGNPPNPEDKPSPYDPAFKGGKAPQSPDDSTKVTGTVTATTPQGTATGSATSTGGAPPTFDGGYSPQGGAPGVNVGVGVNIPMGGGWRGNVNVNVGRSGGNGYVAGGVSVIKFF